MTKQSKKLSKMSLTGFILSFITPLYFLVAWFFTCNNPETLFTTMLLWSVIGFWVSQAAHTVSEIGIIICAVKKKEVYPRTKNGIVYGKDLIFPHKIVSKNY